MSKGEMSHETRSWQVAWSSRTRHEEQEETPRRGRFLRVAADRCGRGRDRQHGRNSKAVGPQAGSSNDPPKMDAATGGAGIASAKLQAHEQPSAYPTTAKQEERQTKRNRREGSLGGDMNALIEYGFEASRLRGQDPGSHVTGLRHLPR